VDAIDPVQIDSTGTPVEQGIYAQDVVQIMKFAGDRIVAIDVAEFNPQLGNLENSAQSVNDIFDVICRM